MQAYDYTIFPNNSPARFKQACAEIEKTFPKAKKGKLLVDVDGSTIQIFSENGKNIRVYDDYDIGAVFVKSDINLNAIFS